jgi:hypothetical protein
MSADPNKKSAHQFQCRDVLWETFEQMARELECSVDYLINEAMKQYAKQRSYGTQRTPYPAPGRGVEAQQAPQSDQRSYPGVGAGGVGASSPPTSPPQMSARPLPPPPGQSRVSSAVGRGPGPATLPVPPPRGGMPVPPPPGMPGRAGPMGMPPVPRSVPPPPPGRSVPPPLPRGGTPLPQMGGGANGYPAPAGHTATLTLIYQGERFPVTKDRFVIGRGKQSSDLTLKDPNVSRQHAMVEFQNGVYFMVDMGSTNGVEYNGQRIARKQIAEGDVFKICDHDLVFTYR